MEIPILLGASPITANPVEWIPIRFSCWKVRTENLVDSELVLCSNLPIPFRKNISNGRVYGPCQVRVEFTKKGTERNISIFAEEHHDKNN